MSAPFEADLCPETGAPRVRFNFSNGWSASLVLLTGTRDRCHFHTASLAACPTGQWGAGKTELLGNELGAEDVVEELRSISLRATP
jgi:hypothetical protein